MTEKTDPRDARAAEDSMPDEFKIQDRRHWAAEEEESDAEAEPAVEPGKPTLLQEYQQRADEAERTLQEYIDAFKKFKLEQDEVRARLNRDVDRKVALKFGGLVGELLQLLDDLELALSHADSIERGSTLAEGLEIARKHFLTTLGRHGVEPFAPTGQTFDPHYAEAVRVDRLDAPERNGQVTETLRPGYMLEDRVLRAARVAVGRYAEPES